MNALLSAFVFLFTSLSRVEYLVCSWFFIRCDLVPLIFFFVSFLSSIVFHVSVFIHSSFRFFCTLVVTCLFRLAPGWSCQCSFLVLLAAHGSDSSIQVWRLSLCCNSLALLCQIAVVSLLLVLSFVVLRTLMPPPTHDRFLCRPHD